MSPFLVYRYFGVFGGRKLRVGVKDFDGIVHEGTDSSISLFSCPLVTGLADDDQDGKSLSQTSKAVDTALAVQRVLHVLVG